MDELATGLGIGMIFILVLVALLPTILFLLTLQNALKAVRPENRTLPPGQVWLWLIPIFNLVWGFIVVNRIADSLANEYRSRNRTPAEERPGYSVGLAYCICIVTCWIPILGILTALGALVLWIIYWVKIAGYKNDLGTATGALDQNI